MKRIIYGLGFCTAVGYAYVRGYIAGVSQRPLVEESEITNDSETEAGEATEDDEDNETELTEFECDDEDCTESFETEHGKNVHMGIAHKDEDD